MNNPVLIYRNHPEKGSMFWNKETGWGSVLKADQFKTMGGAKRSIKRYDLINRFDFPIGCGFFKTISNVSLSNIYDKNGPCYWYNGIRMKSGEIVLNLEKDFIKNFITHPCEEVELWEKVLSKNDLTVYRLKK